MKKLLLIAAMIAIAFTAQGQNEKQHSIEIGAAGIYSQEFTAEKNHGNVGAEIIAAYSLDDNWRVRGTAEINGFIPNGFDRKGKTLVGISYEIAPFYLLLEGGVVCDPSSQIKFSLTGDAGAGLRFKVGKLGCIFTECVVDRSTNGRVWHSNVEVKAGYLFSIPAK